MRTLTILKPLLNLGAPMIINGLARKPAPSAPPGYALLRGADGAYLKGADGAYLYGKVS